MGDVLKKVPVREQAPKVRATNFDEVCLGYNKEEAMEEASRCLTCKKPNRTVKRNPVIRIRMINGSPQTTPSNQVIKLLICVNMFSFLHPFA